MSIIDMLDDSIVVALVGELQKKAKLVATNAKNTDAATQLADALQQGSITDGQIADSLANIYGLPRASADMFEPLDDLGDYGVQVESFRELGCRPLSFRDGKIKVGIADPTKLSVVSTLKNKFHRPVEPYLISASELENVASTVGTEGSSDDAESFGVEADAAVEQPRSEVVQYVSDLIGAAIREGASDIHLEASRQGARSRLRLDGVLRAYSLEVSRGSSTSNGNFLSKNYRAVIARIKIMANLDISERRQPQDGAIFFDPKGNGTGTDIRVSILPSQFGERVVMRVLDKSAVQLDLSRLGFNKEILDPFLKAVESPQGLILVTGPTGSGKTTTQYAALNHLNDPTLNILTVEDPIEYHLDGISQIQVKEEIGFTFAAILRAFLRQDPEILLVGEIRDLETVDIALKAALTGHLVLSTIHTNSAIGTVYRLINMGVEKYLIASGVSYILAQRLARRLCDQCAAIDPDSTAKAKAYITTHGSYDPDTLQVMRAPGCKACGNRGYRGRVGIYEGLSLNTDIQEAILEGVPETQLLALARSKGYKTMQESAVDLMSEGKISFEEFSRVVMV